jgi:hypothetical protein
VATKQSTSLENLAVNVELMASSPSETSLLLQGVAREAIARAEEFTEPGVVFTDDRAPVEQMVHGLILSYLMGQ